jgi:hypothetical protein
MPQAQAAQQRLKHASALLSYGQVSSSLEVHRREGRLASVLMQLVISHKHKRAEGRAPV